MLDTATELRGTLGGVFGSFVGVALDGIAAFRKLSEVPAAVPAKPPPPPAVPIPRAAAPEPVARFYAKAAGPVVDVQNVRQPPAAAPAPARPAETTVAAPGVVPQPAAAPTPPAPEQAAYLRDAGDALEVMGLTAKEARQVVDRLAQAGAAFTDSADAIRAASIELGVFKGQIERPVAPAPPAPAAVAQAVEPAVEAIAPKPELPPYLAGPSQAREKPAVNVEVQQPAQLPAQPAQAIADAEFTVKPPVERPAAPATAPAEPGTALARLPASPPAKLEQPAAPVAKLPKADLAPVAEAGVAEAGAGAAGAGLAAAATGVGAILVGVVEGLKLLKGAAVGAVQGLGTFAQQMAGPDSNPAGIFEGFGQAVTSGTEDMIYLGNGMTIVGAVVGETAQQFGKLERALDATAKKYESFNAQLATAEAFADVRQILGDVRRAQEVGPELAGFVNAQSQLQQRYEDLKAEFIKRVTPLMTGALVGIERIAAAIEPILKIVLTFADIPGAMGLIIEILRWIARTADNPALLDATATLLEGAVLAPEV